jgi:two-component system, chemotaxis family, response regulator Rcp1
MLRTIVVPLDGSWLSERVLPYVARLGPPRAGDHPRRPGRAGPVGMSQPPVEILLVEDNPADVRLTVEVLRDGPVQNHLSVARDGVEALAFLRREGPYAGAARPDLILLDLNLPRKDGREVLAEVKSSPDLRTIPVIVLTTSADDRDVARSYELHANSYIIKPVDFDQFLAAMRSIEDFWLRRVSLPRLPPAG